MLITALRLPMGDRKFPFTARGLTSEGRRLGMCSLKWARKSMPAAFMSAPESGSQPWPGHSKPVCVQRGLELGRRG